MVHIKGITWDHPRGFAPLVAAARIFQTKNPDVTISWDVRSLKDFEDYPIEILAKSYDLILLDHPFIGTGVKNNILVPYDDWISEDYLNDQKANSVGNSFHSYSWHGKQWALAVDAAAQVSAYRADIFHELNVEVPKTWDDVLKLLERSDRFKIGIPLNPMHSFCSFLSLCANKCGHDFWDEQQGFHEDIGVEVLNFLKKMVAFIHERSLEMDPIEMLKLMSHSDEIMYIPLIYGYVNYARQGFAPKTIHFCDIPSTHSLPSGSVLGGVGIAVSAYSKQKQLAVQFATYVASEGCQRGLYFDNGGQPGHRKAWSDPEINRQANGFFENTLRTLDSSFVRPRYPGVHKFQEQAGAIIHRYLRGGADDSQTIVRELNDVYTKNRMIGNYK